MDWFSQRISNLRRKEPRLETNAEIRAYDLSFDLVKKENFFGVQKKF